MSAKEPLISVVIPNYNYGRYLGQAIDSALQQTYSHKEIVVIDNGSTDNSVEVLHRYDGLIHWIQQENQGSSGSRNRGICESRGELIAFLDADDVWRPDKLERQVPLFDNPKVGLVSCGIEYVDSAGKSLGVEFAEMRGHLLRELALMEVTVVPAGTSTAVVRRKCLDKVGLFDRALSYSSDWDMWRRIAGVAEFDAVREPLAQYRRHRGAMSMNLQLFESDSLLAFERMFMDPAAAEVHSIRRQCYCKLYSILAGTFLAAGRRDRFLKYLLFSFLVWPPGGFQVLGTALWRRLKQASGREYGPTRSGPPVASH